MPIMYQSQLLNLLKKFKHQTNNQYCINQLLNDTDYRNHCLSREKTNCQSHVRLLISQIQYLEDVLGHEFCVDLIDNKTVAKNQLTTQRHLMTFAICCLMIVAGSVYAVEEISYNRLKNNQIQAD